MLLKLPIPDSDESTQSHASAARERASRTTSSRHASRGKSTGATRYPVINKSDDDKSDEEAGKKIAGSKIKQNKSDDEDDQMTISEPGSSELVETGGSSGNEPTRRKNLIPKLSGPK